MKTNVKKIFAMVAAICTVASMTVLSASAATQEWAGSTGTCDIVVGQVTVTLDELADAQYKVPVVIKVTPNPGLTTLEFGFSSELSYTVVDDADAYSDLATASGVKLKAAAEFDTTKSGSDNVTWIAWGSSTAKTYEEYILAVFEVPSTAQAGDEFAIKFLNTGLSGNKMIAENASDDGTVTYDVKGVDGFIKIEGGTTTTEATTTTTEATTTTTEATTTTTEATTTTTEATTTTTEATTTTTTQATTTTTTTQATTTTTKKPEVTTAKPVETTKVATTQTTRRYETFTQPKATTRGRTMNPHIDQYYTQTTAKAVPAATARTSTNGTSPKTGASDVLPIAGAAAAVAVLGGVALVSKKKND